jgi:hypothetical protein
MSAPAPTTMLYGCPCTHNDNSTTVPNESNQQKSELEKQSTTATFLPLPQYITVYFEQLFDTLQAITPLFSETFAYGPQQYG